MCIYSILAYREDAIAAVAASASSSSPSPSLDLVYEVTDSTDTSCEKKDEYTIDTNIRTTVESHNIPHTTSTVADSNSSGSAYIVPVSIAEPETDSSEWGLGPTAEGDNTDLNHT